MGKQIPINTKLFDISKSIWLGYSNITKAMNNNFCVKFNHLKPITTPTINPVFENQQTFPSNTDKIKCFMYAPKADTSWSTQSSMFDMSLNQNYVALPLEPGTHSDLRLFWNAHSNLSSKTIYSTAKDKVCLVIDLQVVSSNGLSLQRFSVMINQQALLSASSEKITIQGAYKYSSSFYISSEIRITGIGVATIDGSTLETSTAATYLTQLQQVPIKIGLKTTFNHRDYAANDSYYIASNLTLPSNIFGDKTVRVHLHYFKLYAPKQFYIPALTTSVTIPTTEGNIIDLPFTYSITDPKTFIMGALSPTNSYINNFHESTGYEGDLAISTNDFGDLSVGEQGVAFYCNTFNLPKATASNFLSTNYLFEDFISQCLANSIVEIVGRKGNTYTTLISSSAYNLMIHGATIDNINQYTDFNIGLFIPDLANIRQESDAGQRNGYPLSSDTTYDIRMQFGAHIDDLASCVQGESTGIYTGLKRVKRMFIGTKEVNYFTTDAED